jgi:hypothetical protein
MLSTSKHLKRERQKEKEGEKKEGRKGGRKEPECGGSFL